MLTCTTGRNEGSVQNNVLTGECETSGSCSVEQSTSVDGQTTSNTQTGSEVNTTTTCTGSQCSTGQVASAAIGPTCINGETVALNGAIDWHNQQPGTITFDWGDGVTETNASFPASHTYAESGTYTITVVGANGSGSGQATMKVTVGEDDDTCSYSFVPAAPIAPSGSLDPGESVTFAVEVDQNGQPLSDAPVWLSFLQAPGGGSATACCNGSSGQTSLVAPSQVFVTGTGGTPAGQVVVTYTAPSSCDAGSDTVRAMDGPSLDTASAVLDDGYSFSNE